MINTDGREHLLYRMYDEFGELLYIGVTASYDTRMAYHKSTAPWFKYVTRIETQPAGTIRKDAERLEAAAIRAEEPLKNSNHSTLPNRYAMADFVPVIPTKGMSPISFAEADAIAAEDDSPFAKAFRETLAADPAVRRVDAIVQWAMSGGAK